MISRKFLLTLTSLAALLCGCTKAQSSADGGTSYKVETLGGVPTITADGKPVRSRVLWVANNGMQTISMEDVTFYRNVGRWTNAAFPFSPSADAKGAEIVVDFGDAKGIFAINKIELKDLDTGKVVKSVDFATAAADPVSWSCKDKANAPVTLNVGEDKPDKTKALFVKVDSKVKDLKLSIGSADFKKGAKYELVIRAKVDSERPLTIYAENASEHVYIAPTFAAAEAQIRHAAKVGVDFVSFGVINFWDSDGVEPNYDDIDACFQAVLRANPKAKLIPRIMMKPQYKSWWIKLHSDIMMKNSDGSLNKNFISMSSEEYRRQGAATIRSYIKYCEQNYAEHMVGYHPGGANSYEWFYGDSWGKKFSGYDDCTLAAWRKWLSKKYGTVAALGKAWNVSNINSFDAVEIPTKEEREAPSFLIDPAKFTKITDFNFFLQDEMADTVLTFARAAREAAGSGRLVLFFYGYTFEFCKLRNSPAFSGHYALEKVMKSKDIDCLCGPISYKDRRFGEGKSTMGATETVIDGGKLWFDEDDTRTYLTSPKDPFYIGKGIKEINQAESIEVIRRNLSHEVVRNLGVWWMDLKNQNWYDDPVLWQQMSIFEKIDNDLLRHPIPYRPKVRFVADEASMMYIGANGASGSTVNEHMYLFRTHMNRAGTPFGHYLLSDVLSRKKTGRLNVFLSIYALDSKQRAGLKELAKKSACVWGWAAGYIDLDKHAFSLDAVKDVTGFDVRLAGDVSARVQPTVEGEKVGIREPFGPDVKVKPLFVPTLQNGDTVLATFSDNSPAILLRRSGARPQLFVGTTALSTELLRHMAEISGAHVYTKQPAAVYANRAYVSLTAIEDGEYTVDFDTDKDIFDAYTGAKLGTGPVLKFNLKKADNRMFRIGDGAAPQN